MSTLWAGPWCGELGFELGAWQANVRARSHGYGKTVVACREASRAIYSDFAEKFYIIEHNPNCSGNWRHDGSHIHIAKRLRGLAPEGAHCMELSLQAHTKGEFIRFGHKIEPAYEVVYHARDIEKGPKGRKKNRTRERNWPRGNWAKVQETLGLAAASIGLRDEAMHIPGTRDLRGIPMAHLMDVLHSSRMVVGPSSGPIHLGALCGTRIVAWTGMEQPKNMKRLLDWWNPFRVPTRVLEGWRPTVEQVMAAVERMFES